MSPGGEVKQRLQPGKPEHPEALPGRVPSACICTSQKHGNGVHGKKKHLSYHESEQASEASLGDLGPL